MNLDLTKLAEQVRSAHAQGLALRLPPMTIRELGILCRMLDAPPVQPSPFLR
ncbi:hypothetical protein [Pollutimonas bauzanensis]|uniref:Uncharacterized protein n=1 Tax=Pollutimonas bauzanensis TaxID=658167 RepID=A0A1M5YIX0_9BURK|nr:hypothetical protein [Pollutimonas bauzanensis]SHI11981.1 hypothetical protein SAMN04488135_109139 [Pollutimonas bauzanensis]